MSNGNNEMLADLISKYMAEDETYQTENKLLDAEEALQIRLIKGEMDQRVAGAEAEANRQAGEIREKIAGKKKELRARITGEVLAKIKAAIVDENPEPIPPAAKE